MVKILVDADACPVKDDIYSVAVRHGAPAPGPYILALTRRDVEVKEE